VSPRRIAVVASEVLGVPGTGGPGTADSLLATALARHGHEVRLLVAPGRKVEALSDEWRGIYDGARVEVRPLGSTDVRPPFLGPTMAVLEALRADPPDVVIADDWRGLAYASLRLRHTGRTFRDTAFVVYCHGPARVLAEAARKVPDTIARFGEEVAERASLELADAVVSPSAWLLDWMRSHGWPVPGSAQVVQNLWESVALGQPAPAPPERTAIRRLAFFGQLREGKGIGLFVDAVRRLDRDRVAGLELLFLGRETPRWTSSRIREALGPELAERAASIRFETRFERSEALEQLTEPGTLVVLPSLLENSPYAVAECVERGVPFVAAHVGGVPELVDEDDRERVLFAPTADDLHAALLRALRSDVPFEPVRPARAPDVSLQSWLDLVEHVSPASVPSGVGPARRVAVVAPGRAEAVARRLAEQSRDVEVEVVSPSTRREGVGRTDAEWVVLLGEDDLPEDDLVGALVATQAATGADAVSAAVRPSDTPQAIHVFLGDPGALGLLGNHYGVLALVRRSLAVRAVEDSAVDPDWPLLARIALGGGRIVSIPEPLSRHRGRPGSLTDVPGDGLAVLEAFEANPGAVERGLPQLAAGAGAALMRRDLQSARAASDGRSRSRPTGLRGLARRVRVRLRRNGGDR
jgi:glycosyltransferase involved in cell wall biosynthesis